MQAALNSIAHLVGADQPFALALQGRGARRIGRRERGEASLDAQAAQEIALG